MERRIEARMSVFSKVTLRIGEDRTDVLLLDISRTGSAEAAKCSFKIALLW